MKVYCAAPIRGNTDNSHFTDVIPDIVSKLGHSPLTELSLPSTFRLPDEEIFSRDINWLKESSCIIADVSSASTGVGFEIAYALYVLKLPVLALFKNNSSVSAMIKGCDSALLNLQEYKDISEIEKQISSFLKSLCKDII